MGTDTTLPVQHWSGRAMGTHCGILVVGRAPTSVLEHLAARLNELESKWSRFLADSEISLINASPDSFHLVSQDTVTLLSRARQAWEMTNGAYDPTVLPSVIGLGYDRPFDQLTSLPAGGAIGSARGDELSGGSPGCAEVSIEPDTGLVNLAGISFDPGGIGKGLAGDVLCAEALERGVSGVMVDLGGDVVCAGEPPDGGLWRFGLCSDFAKGLGPVRPRSRTLAIPGGAVVTSTMTKRQWLTAAGPRHHLIDPRTGGNTSGWRTVTVVAAEGWYAEAVAKQLMVFGPEANLDTSLAAALAIAGRDGIPGEDGAVHSMGDMVRFLA